MAETDPPPETIRLESDTLYDVVGVIAATPQLEPVLDGVVGILTRATGCHACFIYLRTGDELVLRAASPVYGHLAGAIRFSVEEGLVGWVVRRNTPAFIRENAQNDPRTNYIPELEEEHFQSMVAVPIPGRDNRVLGAVILHTVAPREFDESTLNVLGHTASLIAGAIENAQLYEQAETRVSALTRLMELSERISAAVGREEVIAAATQDLPALVGATHARVHEAESDDAMDPTVMFELIRARQAGSISPQVRAGIGLPDDAVDVLAMPLTSGPEHHGVLVVAGPHRMPPEVAGLVGAVANQLALALNKAELIERLTADTAVRDLFAALDEGLTGEALAKAQALRIPLNEPVVAVCADLSGPRNTALAERLESQLRRHATRVVAEVSHTEWRALATVPVASEDVVRERVDPDLSGLAQAHGMAVGRSTVHASMEEAGFALREASTATRVSRSLHRAGGLAAFGDVGVYRYLIHVTPDDMRNDTYLAAVRILQDYDERRASALVETLEQYLSNRRGLATTARALTVHPNTLRQRLERIEKLSGLQLAAADLLALEVATKLARMAS